MRTWRVGTISCGLFLIGIGVMLVGMQFDTLWIDQFVKWWPLMLILLGLEVIAGAVVHRGSEERLKYDGISVGIILLFVLLGSGMKFINDVGLLQASRAWFTSEKFIMETSPETIEIGPEIHQLVIASPYAALDLICSKESAVQYTATIHVQAENQARAAEFVDGCISVHSQVVDEKMFIGFDQPLAGNPWQHVEDVDRLRLTVPEDVAIIVEGNNDRMKLVAEGISEHWDLNNMGNTEIRITPDNNCLIVAQVETEDCLLGNVDWNTVTEDHLINGERSENPTVVGQVCLGTGENHIRITSSDRVRLYVEE